MFTFDAFLSLDCFDTLGLHSSFAVSDLSFTSSSHVAGSEAKHSRLNSETTWESCNLGSCSSSQSPNSKPWIQVCFTRLRTISALIIQGPGNKDLVATVASFSLKYRCLDWQDYIFGSKLMVKLFIRLKCRSFTLINCLCSNSIELPQKLMKFDLLII